MGKKVCVLLQKKRSFKMKKETKVITASMVGNALEFYDFSLYGFFAPILSTLFFPSDNSLVSLIQALGVFALGFMTRPIGAIIFGHIGDKLGRKKALSYSVLLMSIPTMAIGLLPTFEQIGIWAPLLLVFCRLCQGLCAGGEYNGSALFALEHNPENKRGFIGGLLTSASEGWALYLPIKYFRKNFGESLFC
jgi:MHS family proline/betaine transporter-like MFS transporter